MISKDALPRAEAYRSLMAQLRDAWDCRYRYVSQQKRSGAYLAPQDYSRYTEGVYRWKSVLEARTLRTFGGRQKRLETILAEWTPRPAEVRA
jgi:hypothetical protein